IADLAVALHPLEALLRTPLQVGRSLDPLLEELRVAREDAARLEVDAEPRRVALEEDVEHRVEPALDERLERAALVAGRELPEELPLRREVVEDRAAGEADLLLEPGDGRPLEAPACEAAAGAVEDLRPAGLEMGC